jgi:hypothetical protein
MRLAHGSSTLYFIDISTIVLSSLDSIKLVYQHPLERRSAATDTRQRSHDNCLSSAEQACSKRSATDLSCILKRLYISSRLRVLDSLFQSAVSRDSKCSHRANSFIFDPLSASLPCHFLCHLARGPFSWLIRKPVKLHHLLLAPFPHSA